MLAEFWEANRIDGADHINTPEHITYDPDANLSGNNLQDSNYGGVED